MNLIYLKKNISPILDLRTLICKLLSQMNVLTALFSSNRFQTFISVMLLCA